MELDFEDSPPAPTMKKLTFCITRHGRSCSNEVKAQSKKAWVFKSIHRLANEKRDPSLSPSGIQTAKRVVTEQALFLNELDRKVVFVYTSCLFRTIMTAYYMYARLVEHVVIVVSPYLKEQGYDDPNMPESIDYQIDRFIQLIQKNGRPATLCYLDLNGNISILYPNMGRVRSYGKEHTTYYGKDGISSFCNLFTNLSSRGMLTFNEKPFSPSSPIVRVVSHNHVMQDFLKKMVPNVVKQHEQEKTFKTNLWTMIFTMAVGSSVTIKKGYPEGASAEDDYCKDDRGANVFSVVRNAPWSKPRSNHAMANTWLEDAATAPKTKKWWQIWKGGKTRRRSRAAR